MKKILKALFITCVLLPLISLSGCAIKNNNNNTNNGSNNNNGNEPSLSIQDYFPMKENVRYIYEGAGNEYASYNVTIDYIADGKLQQRVDNGGTVMVKVFELKDGKLTRLLSRGEAYYRENQLNTKEEEEILLMEPLQAGTTWKVGEATTRTITGTSVAVTTPLGNYQAIEVVTESATSKIKDYYVKNIGLVKTVFISGETEVSSSLSKIEENFVLTQKVSFFYPNGKDEKIYFLTKDLHFNTNDITKQVFETAYKVTPGNSNMAVVFTSNTKINSVYLNKDKMVYIDLNSSFVKEMNAGSGYESLILQSIANTFGKYYQSDKVIITIDNMLYESGHIALKKGEYIPVKDAEAIEMKE